jgi:hypothetical protein
MQQECFLDWNKKHFLADEYDFFVGFLVLVFLLVWAQQTPSVV